MTCDEFFQVLLDERTSLDPARKAALDEHAKGCDDCTSVAEGVAGWDAAKKEPEKFPKDSPWVLESLRSRMRKMKADKKGAEPG